MTFDPYVLIKYHLYLLQLENYQLMRFWSLLLKKGWFAPKELRKNLVWTGKAKLLFVLSELLIIGLALFIIWQGYVMPFALWWQKLLSFLVIVYILDFFSPVFLSISNIIIWPADFVVKHVLILRAKLKIRKLSSPSPQPSPARGEGGLIVVGIAGSYGKTTMKEVVGKVLSIKHKVLSTPDSINTPVGIARWILNDVDKKTELIVVEMGEHYSGDIAALCKITQPDIAVVTGINEAHLERMGKMETVIATIFEIVSGAKAGAEVFLNGDDARVLENYKKFIWPDNKVSEYKVESIKYKIFDTDRLGWKINHDELGEGVFLNLLGEYALGDVDAAIKIAKSLGMTAEEIKKGIALIAPVQHRLEPIKSSVNLLVIDDSYNGNPDGALEAIKVLSRFSSRRKIYLTPGLVEMGKGTAEVHRQIGRELAGVADVVVLIKNSVTPFIEEGIKAASKQISSSAVKIIWFNTAQEAHAELKNILQPWDVILFQNDWGDQYL